MKRFDCTGMEIHIGDTVEYYTEVHYNTAVQPNTSNYYYIVKSFLYDSDLVYIERLTRPGAGHRVNAGLLKVFITEDPTEFVKELPV